VALQAEARWQTASARRFAGSRKAWKNTTSIDFGDRIVFIKTGFEALTGTSDSRASADALRQLFESLPDTASRDTLLWSPTEQPRHSRTYKDRATKRMVTVTEQLTDLEHWFMAFASARNEIIHDGTIASLNYSEQGSAYNGPLFHRAEFVLRAAVEGLARNRRSSRYVAYQHMARSQGCLGRGAEPARAERSLGRATPDGSARGFDPVPPRETKSW
jgi:hypothetical protein